MLSTKDSCKQAGFTFIELIITVAIIGILASATMPLLKMSVQRTKESDLKSSLREVRSAIDAYKKAYDEGRIKNIVGKTGYPPDLITLVEGVEDMKTPNRKKIYFLRKIPIDPMAVNRAADGEEIDPLEHWGLRSYSSPADAPEEGEDVYDIYSLSPNIGINGVPYAKW